MERNIEYIVQSIGNFFSVQGFILTVCVKQVKKSPFNHSFFWRMMCNSELYFYDNTSQILHVILMFCNDPSSSPNLLIRSKQLDIIKRVRRFRVIFLASVKRSV